jgi:hypothetical protein
MHREDIKHYKKVVAHQWISEKRVRKTPKTLKSEENTNKICIMCRAALPKQMWSRRADAQKPQKNIPKTCKFEGET